MKHFSILFLVFASFTLTYGQSIEFEKNETTKYFELEMGDDFQDIETHVLIKNITFDNLEFTWVRDEQVLPNGWETAICDNVRCWTPAISSKNFNLALQDTFSFIVHLYPNDMPGDSAVLRLNVHKEDDVNDNTELKVTFVNGEVVAVSDPIGSQSLIKVIPNPAVNSIRIEDEKDEVRFADLYSITGRKTASYEVNNGVPFNIDQLSSGTYVLRLYDASHNLIVSRRLQKI